MKFLNSLITICFTLVLGYGQQADFNLVEIANVPFPEGCNDIWGYVDDNGIEYALVGTRTASVVLSLEDPTNPIQRARIEGVQSTWRDFKTWKNYAYCVADVGDDGLLIIDMSGAPDNITHTFLNVPFNFNGNSDVIRKCHNLYIDENGFLYLSGCNTGTNGVMIFDLNDNPEQPVFVGAESANYSHDNVVRGDTLWSSDLTAGLSVWDVSDKSNPVELGRQATTSNFCHNAWFSDDNKYVFTTDERPDAFMDAYDVSDPSNIKLLDSYRPKATENRGVIPHNAHFIDGYLVTSWYTDGVKVIDGNKPDNLVEVGSFDSWDGPDGNFNGCWGAYPWLPSGLLLINDIQSGLYVLQPEYKRACYLEGVVTDAISGDPIDGVEIVIDNPDFVNGTNTIFDGSYKTGQVQSGTFDVKFSHPDYIALTAQAELENGEVTVLDVQLSSRPFFKISGTVIDESTKDPVPNAQLVISSDEESYEAQSNDLGLFDVALFSDVNDMTYDIVTGAWGYLHKVILDETIDGNIQLTIELKKGYQDDFIFDLGWETINIAPRGHWERGIPVGTDFGGQFSNPGEDVDTDLGSECYVTGNGGGQAGADDVDDGITILRSPLMDLSDAVDPIMSYRLWFFNAGGRGGNPNDSIYVTINNGNEEVMLEVVKTSESAWRDSSIVKLVDHIELTDSMYISVIAGDDQAEGHLVEGGFDEFRIEDKVSTQTVELADIKWSVFPTVASEKINVIIEGEIRGRLQIMDLNGRVLSNQEAISGLQTIDTRQFISGLYLIQLNNNSETSTIKFFKN